MGTSTVAFIVIVFALVAVVLGIFFVSMYKEKKKNESKSNAKNKDVTERTYVKSEPNRRKNTEPQDIRGRIISESAYVIEKIDERKRVVDAKGNTNIYNELYTLVFATKQGDKLKFNVEKQLLRDVPFNERGLVSHRNGEFISFKCSLGIIQANNMRK